MFFHKLLLMCHFLRVCILVWLCLCVCLTAQTVIQTILPCARVFTLPQLPGIIKCFLSSFPLLSAYSSRHSSSAPVCSCYARCSLFFSPQNFLAVDSLLIPLLFMCHMQQSGAGIVVITNSRQAWCLYFPLWCMMHPLFTRLQRYF